MTSTLGQGGVESAGGTKRKKKKKKAKCCRRSKHLNIRMVLILWDVWSLYRELALSAAVAGGAMPVECKGRQHATNFHLLFEHVLSLVQL